MRNMTWGFYLFIFCVFQSIASAQELIRFHDFKSAITDFAFSPDGTKVIAASNDGTVKIIDTSTGNMLHLYRVNRGMFRDVKYSNDGTKYFITGYSRYAQPSNPTRIEQAFFRVFDSTTNTIIHDYELVAHEAQFSPDDTKVLIAEGSTFIITNLKGYSVLELESGAVHRLPNELYATTSPVSLAYSPDGTKFATHKSYSYTNNHLTVNIWDANTYQKLSEIAVKQFESKSSIDGSISNIAFMPDGNRLITRIRNEGKMQMWDVNSGNEIYQFYGLAQGGSQINLAPEQNYLLTDHSHEAKIWNLETGALATTLLGKLSSHSRNISNVILSSDQSKIATTDNNELIVYDMTQLYIPGIEKLPIYGSSNNSGSGIRTLYTNTLDGENTSAQDHGLHVIPGGYTNADYGQLSFGAFQHIPSEDKRIVDNRRASNLEGMTVTVEPNQVMLVTTPEITTGNPVAFQCYVYAQGEGATVNIGILDSLNQEQNAVSTWSLSEQQTSWKRLNVMFNAESGTYLPLLQVSNSGSTKATVWIDNLRVNELPLDNSEISAFMN